MELFRDMPHSARGHRNLNNAIHQRFQVFPGNISVMLTDRFAHFDQPLSFKKKNEQGKRWYDDRNFIL